MLETITYKLFGFIPLWTITRRCNESELYERMADRFTKELNASLAKNRGVR